MLATQSDLNDVENSEAFSTLLIKVIKDFNKSKKFSECINPH